jgi:hypothetical protein
LGTKLISTNNLCYMSEIPKFKQDMFVDLGDGVCEHNYWCNKKMFPFCFHFTYSFPERTHRSQVCCQGFHSSVFCGGGFIQVSETVVFLVKPCRNHLDFACAVLEYTGISTSQKKLYSYHFSSFRLSVCCPAVLWHFLAYNLLHT